MDCQDRQGRPPEVIVGALLVDAQGRVFVARHRKIAGRYITPGGHVDHGETIAQALRREVREETGLTPTSYRLLQVSEVIDSPLYKDGRHHLIYLDFVVDAWEGTLQLETKELYDGRWLPPEQVLTLPLAGGVREWVAYLMAVGPHGPARYQPGE